MSEQQLKEIKELFPIFKHNPQLVYLDSASSAQKPQSVLDKEYNFLKTSYANIHRGVYYLSQKSSEIYDKARVELQIFLGAKYAEEIIFTRGTTESINLVAYSWAENFLEEGDEIVLSIMEHHANIVPWQEVAKRKNLKIKYVFLTEDFELSVEDFAKCLTKKTKLIALTMLSNSLGCVTPYKEVINLIKEHNKKFNSDIKVLLDAAQYVAHKPINVQEIDCDFLAFSGHKLYGPNGIGVLYGKKALLENMPPFQTGGGMIEQVTLEGTTFAEIPAKFEAGTPNISGAIGLAAAARFVSEIGFNFIEKHDQELTSSLFEELKKVADIELQGSPKNHVSIASFSCELVHPHDISQFFDHKNVAVRAGHHCNQPLMKYLEVSATIRASIGIYNTPDDIVQLTNALKECIEYFRR